MKIIIDVMGGDNAPLEVLRGVLSAEKETDADFILVGNRDEIKDCSEKLDLDISRMEIVHTASVIEMKDDPLSAFKHKKDSSMMVGLGLLADGKGDAFVSAGNTGALFTGATFLVKRLPNVKRAAIGTVIPGAKPFLLLDAGANLSVTPEYLEQFAVMGSVYMRNLYRIPAPTVGLLNNGTEDCKGTPLQIEANERLKNCSYVRYVGNVEGNAAMAGACDVLVTDGFTGNIFLKAAEGAFRLVLKSLKREYRKNTVNKISALLFRKSLEGMKRDFDPSEYGGSPILGISKPVIKAHGSSDARAIKNAVMQAIRSAKANVDREISEALRESR